MTKGALLKDLKNFLGPGFDVDDTGLLAWLNDAYGYVVDEIIKVNPDYFTKSEDSYTVTGRLEYNLPTDYERMLMVNRRIGGTWLPCTPFGSINNVANLKDTTRAYTDTTNPKYYLYGDKIGHLPLATETATALDPNIKIWYVYSPAELAEDDDEPAFPARYHHILKLGAKANYLGRDDEDTAGAQLWQRFESRVEQMVETLSENQLNEPKSIQITSDQSLYFSDDNAI